MAMRALLFLSISVLLASVRVSSTGEEVDTEHGFVKVEVNVKPTHVPEVPAHLLPLARKKVDVVSVAPFHGCVQMCQEHCKSFRKRRPCVRTCTKCCDKYKCVPKTMKCSNWDNVTIKGETIKCP